MNNYNEKLNQIKTIVKEAILNSNNREELWLNILKKIKVEKICEVGVWKGDFAKKILSNIDCIKEYFFIDPWKNLTNWNKPANVNNIQFEGIRKEAFDKNKKYFNKIRELRLPTKEAVNEIKNDSIDFAYIDGNHTLRGIVIDLISILPKIKKGGLIGGDDFTKNIWQHGDNYDPTEVFPFALYFAEANNLLIFTLPFNQFLIINMRFNFKVIDFANYTSLSTMDIYSKPKISILNKIMPNIFKKYFFKFFKI